jgi:predicted Zn-dependent protease
MMTRRAPWILVFAVLLTTAVPALAASFRMPALQDQSEKERKKREEKAAEKEAKEARDAAEVMKDVQGELDELKAALLDQRYDDAFLQDFVNELGQGLVPKETPAGVLFSFRVIKDPIPNAFALPDGRIYVNSGLLVFVDSEAELAVILGHEIGHVTSQHYVQSVKAQKREALVSGILGAAAGGIIGALTGGKKGAVTGAAVGVAAGVVVASIRMNSYSRRQEDEADSIGVQLALDRHYDSKESVAFFKRLSDVYGDQDKFSNALYGRHSRNRDRMAYIDQLLTGELAPGYNKLRSAGALTSGTGQMQMYASRMTRDVAITLMDEFDRYEVSKRLLERIADYRASDPKTLWALGRVFKLVGRTEQDRSRALNYLQRAAELDSRNMYPFIQRDLGLMQARLGTTPAAAESLKKYVLAHQSKYYAHPDDLEEIYDYLLAFGDRTWKAPAIDPLFVRAVAPELTQAPAPVKKADEPPTRPLVKPPAKPPVKKGGGQ